MVLDVAIQILLSFCQHQCTPNILPHPHNPSLNRTNRKVASTERRAVARPLQLESSRGNPRAQAQQHLQRNRRWQDRSIHERLVAILTHLAVTAASIYVGYNPARPTRRSTD